VINASELTKTGAWILEDQGEGIWCLVFDLPDEKLNKLTTEVLEDLEVVLKKLRGLPELKALIVLGGKEDSGTFIAGADIEEIRSITDPHEATQKAQRGQEILDLFATFPAVTIAAIHGNCLGGGAELVLACDLRIASDSPKTKIGLPEVQLGILPGFGGTQRLPRLVGLARALPVILGGRPLSAHAAAKIGLVDRVVYATLLKNAAIALAREALAKGGKKFRPRRPKEAFFMRCLTRTPFGRAFIRSRAKKDVERRVGRHYPAPFQAIEAIMEGFPRTLKEGLKIEASLVGELIASSTSKNLIQLFLSSEAARRGSSRKKSGTETEGAAPTRLVGVLGAGVMGGGIAALLARKGYRVRLKDIAPQAIQTGLAKVHELYSARVKRRRMTRKEMNNSMAVMTTTLDYTGFGTADAVIEAVIEKMEIKKSVLRETEKALPNDAIFASNTSALSITELQSVAERPSQVVGLHFFNPVDRMPLVEIIEGRETSIETLERAEDLARQLGKVPVRVKDGPGFLVNRLLAPYLNEATRLFEEGYHPVRIDEAVRGFGMPMVPFELLDEIGLDVAAKVAVFLHEAFGERLAPPAVMKKLEDAKIIGKKAGKGFYLHGGKSRAPNPVALRFGGTGGNDFKPDEKSTWIRRLIFPIINEAALALEDKIVSKAALVDLGMVMGTGFAPFRGGPLRYADSIGAATIVESIKSLNIAGGKPATLLESLAKDGGTFYGLDAQQESGTPPDGRQGNIVETR